MSGARGGTAHGLSTPTGNHWLARAVCRDEDPELFQPVGTTGPARVQAEQAKSVCRRCPVVDECLAWVVEVGMEWGVAGGRTAEERKAMRVRPQDGRSANRFVKRSTSDGSPR